MFRLTRLDSECGTNKRPSPGTHRRCLICNTEHVRLAVMECMWWTGRFILRLRSISFCVYDKAVHVSVEERTQSKEKNFKETERGPLSVSDFSLLQPKRYFAVTRLNCSINM